MEELYELRSYIEQGKYPEALVLLGEMEEMSREDKANKITSFLEILLLHVIKQHAEKRTTRSWDVSIRNAVREINRSNRRRKAGGYYLSQAELKEAIVEAYENALDLASLEAFEGIYRLSELAEMVDEDQIKAEALHLILDAQ
jgi:hypothetical protein